MLRYAAGWLGRAGARAGRGRGRPGAPRGGTRRGLAAEAAPEGGGGGGSAGRGSPVNLLSLGLTAATGGGLFAYYTYEKQQRLAAPKPGPSAGVAKIGGPFSLTDHHGRPFTDRDLEGEFSVLYFGFTYCPDICPDELEKIAAALKKVEKRTRRAVRFVFITVDPERDDLETLKLYCQEFHKDLLGLRGSPQKTKELAKLYRVYYNKTGEDGDDYLVDHSIITYFLYPDGKFCAFFGKNSDADEIADRMVKYMEEWRAEHPDY